MQEQTKRTEDSRVLEKRTIKDVAQEVVKQYKGISVRDVERLLYVSFDIIKQFVVEDKYVMILEFGSFYAKMLKEVSTIDPQNLTKGRKIPERRGAKFMPARCFQKSIRQKDIDDGVGSSYEIFEWKGKNASNKWSFKNEERKKEKRIRKKDKTKKTYFLYFKSDI